MTTTEKTSIPTLVYFNEKIVSIKNAVKKAKINESQKIVRKIKLLNNKKGNEAQLKKNKRKAENLKQEINEIKKLKFNEVAICSFENEETTFSQYLSKNKNLSLSEISLARIGLSKVIVDEINKIKIDPKIDGWKTIFIQYKARCEKRKSWKDKLSQVKEIESKLNTDKNSDAETDNELDDQKDSENEEDKKMNDNIDDSEKNSGNIDNGLENSSKKVNKEKILKIRKDEEKDIKQIQSDSDKSDNDSDESEKSENNSGTIQNDKIKTNRDLLLQNESEMDNDDEVSLSESEDDAPLDLDNYELGGFSDEENDLSPNDLFSIKSENDTIVSEEIKLKPIVYENKQNSRMFIKQFNLDEMKDLSEIPTNPGIKIEEEDESDPGSSDELKNQFRIDQDPFFLDQNGNEIENTSYEYEHEKFRNRRQEREDDYEPQSYSSYDRYQSMKDSYNERRQGVNSSFKSSLSSNNNSYDKGRNNFSSNRGKPADRGKSNNNSRFNNSTYKKDNIYDRDSRYAPYKQRDTYQKPYEAKQATQVETKSLHPSWQAKKQMEDRGKLKFSGKKMTFDD